MSIYVTQHMETPMAAAFDPRESGCLYYLKVVIVVKNQTHEFDIITFLLPSWLSVYHFHSPPHLKNGIVTFFLFFFFMY